MSTNRLVAGLCTIVLFIGTTRLPAEEYAPPERLADAVSGLLNAGFQIRAVSASDLKNAYQSAQRKAGGDHPYLDYAYWLVLNKNLQTANAQKYLQSAAQSRDPIVLPAREQLIWNRLQSRDYFQAIEMLVDLAETLRSIPSETSAAADARRSAEWIGRIMGYLEGPLKDAKIAERAQIADGPIRRWLGTPYSDAYLTGRTQVADVQRELVNQLAAATEQAAAKKVKLEEAAQEKAKQTEEHRKKLEDVAQEIETVAKDEQGEIKTRLAVLEKNFVSSLEAEQRLLVLQAKLQQEVLRLKRQIEFEPNDRRDEFGNSTRLLLAMSIQAREDELASLLTDHALLLQSRYTTSQTANGLLARLQASTEQFQQNSAQARDAVELMKQWQSRFEVAAKRHSETPVAKMPEIGTLRRRMASLSTYEHRSLNDQRDRLLVILGIDRATQQQEDKVRGM